jgi:manganese efflux pump family protein
MLLNDVWTVTIPSFTEIPTANFVTVLLIALGLSADCFAVSLSASISSNRHSRIGILRTAFSFGIFQAVMPLIGWLAGRTVADIIQNYDHWVAFGLLAFVGGKMVWESFFEKEEKERDISKGLTLITLSVATSIDALAVGLSFAFMRVNIWTAIGTIGLVAFLVTGLGFMVGKKVGGLIGKRAELVGGLVLIGIGLKILIEHLLS